MSVYRSCAQTFPGRGSTLHPYHWFLPRYSKAQLYVTTSPCYFRLYNNPHLLGEEQMRGSHLELAHIWVFLRAISYLLMTKVRFVGIFCLRVIWMIDLQPLVNRKYVVTKTLLRFSEVQNLHLTRKGRQNVLNLLLWKPRRWNMVVVCSSLWSRIKLLQKWASQCCKLASLKMIFCTKWRNMTVSSFILLFLTGTPSPISIISEDTFLSNKHGNNTCSFALFSYREETQVFHYENLWNNSLVYDFSFHIQHASSHLASNSTLLDLSLMMCTLSKTIF